MTLGWGPVRPSPSSFNLEERGEQWGRSTQISGQTYSEEISVLARAEETIIKRSQVVAAMLGPVDDWRLEEGSSLGLPVPDLRTACPDVRHRHGGGGTGTTHVNPWRHKDMRGQNWQNQHHHLLSHFPGNFSTKCQCQSSCSDYSTQPISLALSSNGGNITEQF